MVKAQEGFSTCLQFGTCMIMMVHMLRMLFRKISVILSAVQMIDVDKLNILGFGVENTMTQKINCHFWKLIDPEPFKK